MSYFPENHGVSVEEMDKSDKIMLYAQYITEIFNIMSLLETETLNEFDQGFKQLELEELQKKTRYISEEFEKPFRK